jgi:hypothetical protein
MIAVMVARYGQLLEQAKTIEAGKFFENELYGNPREQVNRDALLNWKVKAKSLLIQTCGADSIQVSEFIESESGTLSTSLSNLRRMMAVLSAAKEDYEGGYLASTKSLVQAQMFLTELEQARQLHKGGYLRGAAVIAGVVLETTLRELCERNKVMPGTLAKMNDELAKVGAYNELRKKQITALCAIRNNAAHEETLAFDARDVGTMLTDIERFVADHI